MIMNYTCFTCHYWNGSRRKDKAYCKKLFLSGKDATSGDDVCGLWEKRSNARTPKYNRDTELLHLCWLVEEKLNEIESADYAEFLHPITANYKLLYRASWQPRVIALAEVKGIEI